MLQSYKNFKVKLSWQQCRCKNITCNRKMSQIQQYREYKNSTYNYIILHFIVGTCYVDIVKLNLLSEILGVSYLSPSRHLNSISHISTVYTNPFHITLHYTYESLFWSSTLFLSFKMHFTNLTSIVFLLLKTGP